MKLNNGSDLRPFVATIVRNSSCYQPNLAVANHSYRHLLNREFGRALN